MLKRLLPLLALLVVLLLLSIPAAAQENARIEIRLNGDASAANGQFSADVIVLGGSGIAGADIAIAVDGTCLQVAEMIPGDYLPSAAENGGFAPMNTYDITSARLAANVTDRAYIASGDGVFMSVMLNAVCAEQTSTISVTRAQLVTVDGTQITPATADFDLQIGSDMVDPAPDAQVEGFVPVNVNGSEDETTNTILMIAIAALLFSFFGFVSLVGWQFIRTRTG